MAMVMKALQNSLKPPGGQATSAQKESQQKGRGGLPQGLTMEEMLTCRICVSPYTPDADGKRLPRDLGCGHVFCQRCLTDCISGSDKKSFIVCPLCKKKTTLTGSSIMELPVNRQLLGLVRGNQGKKQGHRGDGRNKDLEGSGKRCGKNCSCEHRRSSGEKQIILKSALKKPKSSDGSSSRAERSAGVKYHSSDAGVPEQQTGYSAQQADLISSEEAGGVFQGEVDFIGSLTDMLHLQPTSSEYVSSFGRYSEERSSPADFSGPTKISCSKENKIVIVDPEHESVQAFSTEGHCLANFSAPGVNGGCFLDESTLAVSSQRGIELYRLSGRLLMTIPLPQTIAIARYTDGGFVAAQPTRISIGSNPTSKVRLHTIGAVRQAADSTKRSFVDISDVAASSSGEVVVIDDRSVIVMDYEGILKAIIDPSNLLLASPSQQLLSEAADLFIPYAVAVDPLSGQVTVCDAENRCISTFAVPGGGFVRTLVNFRDQVENEDIRGYGIAINSVGQLFVALRAYGLAEIAIYNI